MKTYKNCHIERMGRNMWGGRWTATVWVTSNQIIHVNASTLKDIKQRVTDTLNHYGLKKGY